MVAGYGFISHGEIPWTALDRYAARHAIDDPDEFDLLVRFVRALDRDFVTYINAKLNKR